MDFPCSAFYLEIIGPKYHNGGEIGKLPKSKKNSLTLYIFVYQLTLLPLWKIHVREKDRNIWLWRDLSKYGQIRLDISQYTHRLLFLGRSGAISSPHIRYALESCKLQYEIPNCLGFLIVYCKGYPQLVRACCNVYYICSCCQMY